MRALQGVLLLLALLGLSGRAAAEPSAGQVLHLQRVLANGCGMRVERDGLWGSQTEIAYRRCRESHGFIPVKGKPRDADIAAFMQAMWTRKLALILLHQYGHLREVHSLRDGKRIEAALAKLSAELGLKKPLPLNPAGVERLYKQYLARPPAGSLAAAAREKSLPRSGLEFFLQAFKKEGEVHVFARRRGSSKPFVPLKIFPITGAPFTYPEDGPAWRAGPKTVQGDDKVPEGAYYLSWQIRWSDYHLGYLLSYPNNGDEIRRQHWRAGSYSGGSIVLHGNRFTIGCIPVGDDGIEEIFLLLNRNWSQELAYGRIHIFPCRFDVEENEAILAHYARRRPELQAWWESLRPLYHYFEKTRLVPETSFDADTGYYVLESASLPR